MLSEHCVFEGYSQEHDHKEREEGDGGWRMEGREGWTEGTEHLLVYGASGTERGVKHGLVYISQEAHSNLRIRISAYIIIIFLKFQIP